MVIRCCAHNCRTYKRPNLVFHRFPLGDPNRLRQWLSGLNMDGNTPPHVLTNLFVCQKHFQPDDYHAGSDPSRPSRLLKSTAVPNLSESPMSTAAGEPDSMTHLDPLVGLMRSGFSFDFL